MSNAPLMPMATAVWLVENTTLTFKQIAEFCKLHEVEIQGIADGEVAKGIKAYNPIISGQLTREEIDLSSKDVIHNFKLPELRVSQDAIPGMVIPVHFTATSTSEEFLKTAVGTKREGKGLEIACAQLCGLGHYRMKGYVTIHEEDDYQAWLDEQAAYLEEEDGDDWGDDGDDWGDDDW